jgi:hypothetical protein
MLLKLGVFLLLGVVVNVAVAWGCAAWCSFDVMSSKQAQALISDGNAEWRVLIWTAPGYEMVISAINPPRNRPTRTSVMPTEILPRWVNIGSPKGDTSFMWDGRGWPMISMACTRIYFDGVQFEGDDRRPG